MRPIVVSPAITAQDKLFRARTELRHIVLSKLVICVRPPEARWRLSCNVVQRAPTHPPLWAWQCREWAFMSPGWAGEGAAEQSHKPMAQPDPQRQRAKRHSQRQSDHGTMKPSQTTTAKHGTLKLWHSHSHQSQVAARRSVANQSRAKSGRG